MPQREREGAGVACAHVLRFTNDFLITAPDRQIHFA